MVNPVVLLTLSMCCGLCKFKVHG